MPRLLLIFSLTLAAMCLVVIVFPYEYRDSDSACYNALSQRLSSEPLTAWCAPQWWGWADNEGLFQEHPPGILWLPALLDRLGVKPGAAALCANFLYVLLSLFFIYKLTLLWGNAIMGWGAAFGVVLTPVFIQYLIRANQEPPLNLAVLAGIYGLARYQKSRRAGGIFVAALIMAVLIKGVSVLLLSMLAGLFWLIVARNKRTFVLILFGHLAVAAVVVLFELWYRAVVHLPFWQSYYFIQSARSLEGGFNVLRKPYNIAWYAVRVLVFAAPWVYFLLYEFFSSKKRKLGLLREPFMRFLLAGSAAVIVFFSLSDRKADRYIFPAYILLVLAGLVAYLKARPAVIGFLAARERRLPVYLGTALSVLTLIRIFFHSHLYRFIRFWPQ